MKHAEAFDALNEIVGPEAETKAPGSRIGESPVGARLHRVNETNRYVRGKIEPSRFLRRFEPLAISSASLINTFLNPAETLRRHRALLACRSGTRRRPARAFAPVPPLVREAAQRTGHESDL